ncbi:serine/threonine-protein kinase [Aquisphaera insulae]|uniref:serine/threonine-protein kinase n=1 Tax=Aquisphaera insulae TaxID=2712864 RepID=UPI0013EA69BF|nr:serine/threonine-protein kinase [Aquisphaera insulae]
MTEADRLRVRALFARVADLPPEERGAFLDEACRGEPEIRERVDRLLAFDARSGPDEDGFLKSPVVRTLGGPPSAFFPLPQAPEPELPSHISRYRILRRHGEGGMGTVYEAEQANPRRTVALKVLRPSLLSPAHLLRFGHEAEILGRLQHSGIAQVYEAGMVEDGRPYFAMEFIRGMPLDEFARDRGLDATARLELLALVCDAVQHAHDKGVVHRDLKPGNILVDESGQPKVLDFGVAHVTASDMLTTSNRTQTGELLGTLNYMSPEQIAGDSAGLDGRSDVYTLGVILFELLSGRLPYRVERLPVHEVARVIQEQEPSRLGALDTALRGDVDIIVAKALEKDRTRRYASAGDLASDIRRHLRGDLVLARPASALYQLRKLARRHKALVAGAAGIFAALLVGTIVSVLFALRAAENARVANERERTATYQSYRSRIAAAVAALSHHDVADAARQLDAAPPAWRDWEWRHLSSRLDDSTFAFPAIAGGDRFLISDPQGTRIASWTPAGLSLSDLAGNEMLSRSSRLDEPSGRRPPLPTRNGLRLVLERGDVYHGKQALKRSSHGRAGNLVLRDDEGRERTRLRGPEGADASLVSVSLDGTQVAVVWVSDSGWSLALYDPDSGRQRAALVGKIGYTWAIAFNPDGTRLATAEEDGVVRVWDTSDGRMIAECRGHARKALSVSFRGDGRRLVTTSADGTVRRWDPATGMEDGAPYEQHSGETLAAVYSPNGDWVASGGTDRTVRVWRTTDLHDVAVLHGHTGVVRQLAFAPDGRRLASASQSGRAGDTGDGTVRIWDVDRHAGMSVLRGHTSYVYPVAFSPDGRSIASGSWDGTVRLWDAATSKSREPLAEAGVVRDLSFGPDGTWLVIGCAPGSPLKVRDVSTGRLRKELKAPGALGILAIAVSPDGARVAAGDADGNATIVDVATSAEVFSFRMAPLWVKTALAYSPDGRLLASTSEDGTGIDLRDARTHVLTARLTGHSGHVHSVAFRGDGHLLASTGDDRTVRIWDVATATCTAVLTGHTDEVFAVAFHPDGTRLASAGRDRAVWLWDLSTGEEVARLEGHTNYVFSLAFSPDGTTLASGSGDGTVRTWDTRSPSRRPPAGWP